MFKSALSKLFCLVSGMRYVKENSTYYGRRSRITNTDDIGFFISRSPHYSEYSFSLFGKCFLRKYYSEEMPEAWEDSHRSYAKQYSFRYVRCLDKWFFDWGNTKKNWKNPIGYYVAEEDFVTEGTTKFSWYDEKYGLVTVDVERYLIDRRRLLPFISKKRFALSAKIEKAKENNFYGSYFTVPQQILSLDYLKETVKP